MDSVQRLQAQGHLALPEASLPGLQMVVLPVSSQGCPSVCVCVLISPSYKDTIWIGLGPP